MTWGKNEITLSRQTKEMAEGEKEASLFGWCLAKGGTESIFGTQSVGPQFYRKSRKHLRTTFD